MNAYRIGCAVGAALCVLVGGAKAAGTDTAVAYQINVAHNGIQTDDSSRRDTRGEIDGDCPRPTPDVEETQAWPEKIEQVRGGVLCRSPSV